MESIEAKVVLTSLRSNLVNLPADVVSLLYSANINVQGVVIEISWKPKRLLPLQYAYAGWSGMTSTSSQGLNMEIDPVFASSIGLKENTKVMLKMQFNAPEALKIHLEPVSSSDWELVEIHAQFLESRLLNQTRAVKLDQTLVVYPSSTIIASLKVVKIEPVPDNGNFAKISPNCEVIIAPKVRKISNSTGSRAMKSMESIKKSQESLSKMLFRNICVPHNLFDGIVSNNDNIFEVFVNFNELKEPFKNIEYVNVSLIAVNETVEEDSKSPEQSKKAVNSKKHSETPINKYKSTVARLINHPNAPTNYVGISKILAQTLGIQNSNGNLLVIQSALRPLSQKPRSILIHPFITKTPEKQKTKVLDITGRKGQKKDDQLKLIKIKEYLTDCEYFNNNSIATNSQVPLIKNVLPFGGSLEFELAEGWFVINSIDEVELKIGIPILKVESEMEKVVNNGIESTTISLNDDGDATSLIGYDDLKSKILATIRKDINGVLIHGASGSGKSLLISSLIKELHLQTTHKIILINLEEYLNEINSFEALKKTFNKIFLKLVSFEKVILILENIDLICYKESEQGGMGEGNNSLTINFTEYFINNYFQLMNGENRSYDIKLILTANSKDTLNKVLLSNPLLLNEYFKVSPPDKQQRSAIINHYLEAKKLKFEDQTGVELNDLLNDTEGYLPNDLKTLIDRAYHEVLFDYLSSEKCSSENKEFVILPEHFKKSLEGFTSTGLRNIKLQQSKVKWEDIGGLKDAKEILLETLEWPTKYAPIFANCPLRLRSGILLYGYPGCGKTLLASAVSSQCGLNFISVKGPEILNKYIGASEQSVRELFERAQAAKPCILFFDEFDSIAPKRGHDSTGVTDRVVNQMLTQMDGAEGLDGVYVLAATSRPDLIDSALLRPGRLDKSVICDIPDFENRWDIIDTVTSKMNLDGSGIDLNDIARITEGFSGADLQALCYNAYLNAVHRKLKNDEIKKEKSASGSKDSKMAFDFFQLELSQDKIKDLTLIERTKLFKTIETIIAKDEKPSSTESDQQGDQDFIVYITEEDFQTAIKETSPSISASERMKLKNIYSQFIADRDGNMPDGLASNQIGGRTTLM